MENNLITEINTIRVKMGLVPLLTESWLSDKFKNLKNKFLNYFDENNPDNNEFKQEPKLNNKPQDVLKVPYNTTHEDFITYLNKTLNGAESEYENPETEKFISDLKQQMKTNDNNKILSFLKKLDDNLKSQESEYDDEPIKKDTTPSNVLNKVEPTINYQTKQPQKQNNNSYNFTI